MHHSNGPHDNNLVVLHSRLSAASPTRGPISDFNMAILWPNYKDWSTSGCIRSHPATSISPSTRASSCTYSITSEAQDWESKDENPDIDDTMLHAHEGLVQVESSYRWTPPSTIPTPTHPMLKPSSPHDGLAPTSHLSQL